MKSAHAPASASEASTYRRCPRLWVFKYRWDDGPKVSRPAYFAVGSKFDKIVEDYWKLGIIPTDPNDSLTQLFVALLPIIPGPGQHRALQFRDTWETSGLQIQTIPDYLGEGLVGDLKTTKNIKDYGLLTKEQKLDDMQAVMYAYRYLPEGGIFDHWYAQKHRAVELQYEDKILDKELALKLGKKVATAPIQPKASGSPIHLTRPEIEDAFERVARPSCTAVVQLRKKHALIDPMSLPLPEVTEDPKDSPCEAYGGCEYKKTCFPTADFRRANLTSTYSEVNISPSTMEVSVKFKIQKPDVQAGAAAEPACGEVGNPGGVIPDPAPAKKFTPFKKAVQTEIPTDEEALKATFGKNRAKADEYYAKEAAEAAQSEVPVEVTAKPIPEMIKAAREEIDRTVIEPIKADIPVLESPATVELEVDEPTIPVESLLKTVVLGPTPDEAAPLKFEDEVDPRVTQVRVSTRQEVDAEDHALRVGRAVLEILDVLRIRG